MSQRWSRRRAERGTFVALTLDPDEQECRIVSADRATFGKLRSVELLRELRGGFVASMATMPAAAITIDTGTIMPEDAAAQIAEAVARQGG